MDRRIDKTNKKILAAFKELIKVKEFSDITIDNILETANIARSTFYKHYKTKNEVLKDLVDKIFLHVFGESLIQEQTHDFSNTSLLDYKHYISHILYHIKDERELIHALLHNQGRGYLIHSIIDEFTPFAHKCIDNNFFTNNQVPEDLLLSSIVHNFILIINYWDETGFKSTPEELTDYYIIFNK